METAKKIRERISQQRAALAELDKLAEEIDSVDLVHENDRLMAENRKLESSLATIRPELAAYKERLSRTREALASQIASERLQVLALSRKRIDALFSSSAESGENRLSQIEKKASRELTGFQEKIAGITAVETDTLNAEIADLSRKVAERIAAARKELEEARINAQKSSNRAYRDLERVPLDDETLAKRVKQNRFEVKIGLNLVNKIGVILLLLGLGASIQYGYIHFFNEWIKGSFAFLLALVLLFFGELAWRKKFSVFASGLTGGGIAALYGALFYSHFILQIIPMEAALVVSLLVAAGSIALTLRYNSQTIAAISLAGGFLPFFSYSLSFNFDRNTALLAFGYIFILNATLIAISLVRSWKLIAWISFVMSIPCVIVLADRPSFASPSIMMFVLTYIVYQTAVLLKPLRHRIEPAVSDIVLMSLNSLVVSLAVFGILDGEGLNDYYGLVAVLFSACFLAQGLLLYRFFSIRSVSTAILFGCALTFSVLAVPFQFGLAWALVGWVCEGVFLAIAGNRYRAKYLEAGGWGVLALTALYFYASDLFYFLEGTEIEGISVKFASLAAGVYALALYYGRYLADSDIRRRQDVARFFAWSSAAVSWIFLVTLVPEWVERIFVRAGVSGSEFLQFFTYMALALAHIALAVFLRILPPIRDRHFHHASTFFQIMAGLVLAVINATIPVFPSADEKTALGTFAFAMLVAANCGYVLLLRSMILAYLKRGFRSLELYPAALVAWLLSVLASFMIVQFDLGVGTVAFTTAVLLFALGAVTYGFIKRYRIIRVSSLALVIITLAKFFIYDLSGITLELRILSFFGYGIILIAISFLYQRMKVALDAGDTSDE